MGNEISSPEKAEKDEDSNNHSKNGKPAYMEFISSAGKTIGQATGAVCGSLNDTFEEPNIDMAEYGFGGGHGGGGGGGGNDMHFLNPEDDKSLQSNPMSTLFARALLNEVTDNPSTMTPAKMTEREKKLLKAQMRASSASKDGIRAIGGQGTMKSQFAGAGNRIIPSSFMPDQRSARMDYDGGMGQGSGKHTVTIGLMLSSRHSSGHPGTVTRQTAFDFNKLQDREYKYVSSTDASGWRAGGGERGGPIVLSSESISNSLSDEQHEFEGTMGAASPKAAMAQKIPAPDMVHIPIIHIDCESEGAVNSVIAAIARGEVFIPHMSVMPEGLGVNGISPPDLVVRFGCERNDDFPPEDWPNWCLEFMHNQLYEYFSDMGARWMKRPFQITLAKKVRWKTVKHMNKFFAHSETVINQWREKGPQYLDPQLAHIEGGATPEEVARPHGIYLLRNGKPTNYFAPNFEPPYTTKMTRSLLQNVIAKSWDKKRRDWSTAPIPIVTPSLLLSTMCGCAEPNQGGFIAREATNHFSPLGGGGTFFGDARYDYDLTLNENVKQDRQLMESMKITHQDSGITRSQIGNVRDKKPSVSPKRGRSESMGGRSEKSRSREVPQKATSTTSTSESFGYDSKQNVYEPQQQQNVYEQQQQNVYDQQQDEYEPERSRYDHAPDDNDRSQSQTPTSYTGEGSSTQKSNGLDYSESDTSMNDDSDYREDGINSPSPDKGAPPVNFDTPLMSNRLGSMKNDLRIDVQAEGESPEVNNPPMYNKRGGKKDNGRSPARATKLLLEDELLNASRSVSPSEITGNQSTGLSVGESQTTVPIMNRSSTKFIEQERERRKERELEREKERRKIDELELAIQEKLRIHEEKKKKKAADKSLEENDIPMQTTSQLDPGHETKRKSTKEEKRKKREKKEKKKREKKERKDRERSRSVQRSRSTSRASNDTESTHLSEPQSEPQAQPQSSSHQHQTQQLQKSSDALDQLHLSKENQENRPYKSDPVHVDNNDRQNELYKGAATTSSTSMPVDKTTQNDFQEMQDSSFLPINLSANASSSHHTNHTSGNGRHQILNPSSPASYQAAPEIASQASMDYSMDTASLMGDGSLLGGQFAGDSSVFTMGTTASDNKSLLSCVTRSTVHDMNGHSPYHHQQQQQQKAKAKLSALEVSDESDDISLSLMASSSSGNGEKIPSDDELFAIGWAKAMDPSSGCYYYFTLDRSQTVWENPLTSNEV